MRSSSESHKHTLTDNKRFEIGTMLVFSYDIHFSYSKECIGLRDTAVSKTSSNAIGLFKAVWQLFSVFLKTVIAGNFLSFLMCRHPHPHTDNLMDLTVCGVPPLSSYYPFSLEFLLWGTRKQRPICGVPFPHSESTPQVASCAPTPPNLTDLVCDEVPPLSSY